MTKSKAKARPASRVESESNLLLAAKWTFLTNHAHVLLCLYRKPDQRVREVANLVGITERMVQRILIDLVDAEYVTIRKEGRRNRYSVDIKMRLRHPLEGRLRIGELLKILEAS